MACWKFSSTTNLAQTGLLSEKKSVFSYHQTLQMIRHNSSSEQQAIESCKREVVFFPPQN